MSALRVSVRRRVDGVVVVLTGELDLAEVGRMTRRVLKLEQESPAALFLDLRSLSFLDSSGLQGLVEIDARGRSNGRRVAFIRGPGTVHRLFELTRLEDRVEILDDLPPE